MISDNTYYSDYAYTYNPGPNIYPAPSISGYSCPLCGMWSANGIHVCAATKPWMPSQRPGATNIVFPELATKDDLRRMKDEIAALIDERLADILSDLGTPRH